MSTEPFASEQPMAEDAVVVRAKTDRIAFGLLYDCYHPRVFRYCLRRLFDRTIAEDIVSDVFLTVAASIRDFPGRTAKDFRCWLFRLATNAVNAHLRQSQRRRVLLEAAARDRSWEHNDTARTTPSTWETLDWPAVYEALLELDERDQAIVMLRYFAGCSYDEIAEVVSTTAGAVRTALSRTLTRLRDRFNPSPASNQALGTSSKD